MVACLKRVGVVFVSALFACILLSALAPNNAWAHPVKQEIAFNNASLSTSMPQGVRYDSGSGVMTLDNYHGGMIDIGGAPGNFSIVLKGDNVIEVEGVSLGKGWNRQSCCIKDTGAGHNLSLYGLEGSSLTLKYRYIGPEPRSFDCIWVGGDLRIAGDLALNVVGVSDLDASIPMTGIKTGGGLTIQDHVSATVTLSAHDTSRAVGMSVGADAQDMQLMLLSDNPLTIDLSGVRHKDATVKSCGLEFGGVSDPFVFEGIPTLTVLAEECAISRDVYAAPDVAGYQRTDTWRSYVYAKSAD